MNIKQDMIDWEWRAITLEDCPQSEFNQLKSEIRECWNDPEKRTYWEMRIAEEGAFSRELRDMAKTTCARVKAMAKLEIK